MTIHEASERDKIPVEILRQYERWELGGAVKQRMGEWQYKGIQRLSLMITLRDVGFTSHRNCVLDETHVK